MVGIAQTDEFAYSLDGLNQHYGSPPNPASPGTLAGGSSSGPASAVASGQADLGLGSDTAGSIRVPASYQGLWGLRTTHGAVATAGMLPLAPTFDAVGLLAPTLRKLDRAARCLLAGHARRHAAGVAVTDRSLLADVDDEIRRSFDRELKQLVSSGAFAKIEETDFAAGRLPDWAEAFRVVQAAEAWRSHGQWVRAHPGALGTEISARFDAAAALGDAEIRAAGEVLQSTRQAIAAVAEERVLLLPTTPGPALPLGADRRTRELRRAVTVRLCCLASIAGLPALSAPILEGEGGRPAGMSFVGPAGSDLSLLELAGTLAHQAVRPSG